MRSLPYRVRLDEATAEELRDFAEDWRQPMSAVIRDAVRDLLAHPERYPEILSTRMPYPLEDSRTPEQAANGERYRATLLAVDLDQVAAQMTQPGA
jgi:hypothetical protein